MSEIDLEYVKRSKDMLNESDDASSTESLAKLTEYMRVVMNGEIFLVAVDSVLSVLRPAPLTPVPMAPDHIMGVSNVRGQVFCIVDPGKILNLEAKRKEETKQSRFMLLRHPRVNLGIWVEDVLDLLRLDTENTEQNQSDGYDLGRVETVYGILPILRTDALFD